MDKDEAKQRVLRARTETAEQIFRDRQGPEAEITRTVAALERWQVAFGNAAKELRKHGMEVHCPWEGDLDDAETERYNGMVEAIDAYLTVFQVRYD